MFNLGVSNANKFIVDVFVDTMSDFNVPGSNDNSMFMLISLVVMILTVHPVSVRRFPSFRTQPLENLTPLPMTKKNRFLSNPAPGENLLSGNLLWRPGVSRKTAAAEMGLKDGSLPMIVTICKHKVRHNNNYTYRYPSMPLSSILYLHRGPLPAPLPRTPAPPSVGAKANDIGLCCLCLKQQAHTQTTAEQSQTRLKQKVSEPRLATLALFTATSS